MGCCSTQVIESRFNQDYVDKKLKKFRKRGPKKTTSILASALHESMVEGMTLLDIGGGIGDLQHILIPLGVRQTYNCEASNAYLSACDEEATRQGYSDRITHLYGDFVEIAEKVPNVDIVTLDRVICCYPEMEELVQRSIEKARALYGIVVPKENFFIKLITGLYYNLRFLIQKNSFRVFVHPIAEIEAIINKTGFHRIFHQRSGGWEIFVYASKDA